MAQTLNDGREAGSAARRFRRLSGVDGHFLNLEMPGQPMQIIALGLLRSPPGVVLTLEDLRRHLATRLDQLPAFRRRLVPVPMGLANSVLVDDPYFDLTAHLSRIVLPAPGGPEELDAACGRLVSRHLDRSRPLWRITLIDGLADGRQALVLEVHHAVMDGFATGTALARIFADGEAVGPPALRASGRLPGRGRMVAAALAEDARLLARLPGLIGRARQARAAVRQRLAEAVVTVPKAGVDVPASLINTGFTAERRFAQAALPLDAVLTVKEAAGVTVNDVALAVVGGALRAFLQARDALPDRPLVAGVPVGMTESVSAPRAEGNRISFLRTTLASDIADPWERLRRVSAVTTEAKACLELEGRELVEDWLACVPPILGAPAARRHETARRRPDGPPVNLSANVVVSNLRGPASPWQLGSTVVEEVYMAPPGEGAGVNFLFWDYADRLCFGILSFSESIEDPRELATGLSRSLDEFVAAGIRRVPTA
ncbi:MAG TPA: wax ester/triacylglycerol synthase family O-acyltransferase [Pseudonocardiaceae bacterium]|nr:wax ester/triacylglycerol synthase family O-acyltransferase [Pseudonocardiaceae bacterium]